MPKIQLREGAVVAPLDRAAHRAPEELPLEIRRVPSARGGLSDGVDLSKVSRGTGPIECRAIAAAKRAITMREVLFGGDFDPAVRDEFIAHYKAWIGRSRATPARGLDVFPNAYFADGVTQVYDLFFSRHRGRRFRTLQDEYPYTRLSVDRWVPLEAEPIREDDAVALSCPFYGTGGPPREYEATLDACARLAVPVMIDAAYFGTCYGTKLDYSHPAIEMVGFSLSKTFAAQSFRIGLLLSKVKIRSLEEIQVSANYFNRVGAYVGLRLMREFSADYLPERYRSAQQAVCRAIGARPTHCLLLASLDDDDRRFDEVLLDERFDDPPLPEGARRRLCISGYLADRPPGLRDRVLEEVSELRRRGARSVLSRL